MFRIIAVAIGIAVAALASAAGADPASVTPITVTASGSHVVSRVVRIRTADLTTSDGAQRTAERIRIAAAYVCGGDNPLTRAGDDFSPCRQDAMTRALATLNAPM